MRDIAVKFKLLNLYAHVAHNVAMGSTFSQDHEMFADIYGKADGYYDSVIERMIGLDQKPDIVGIIGEAAQALKPMKVDVDDNDVLFMSILSIVNAVMPMLSKMCKAYDTSEGTKQLLGGIADELEVLKYKIKQRLK